MAEIIKLGTSGNWGVKDGGTLAYNDENGVFKAIELASSRSSGATYVGEDGLIKDAEVGVPRIDWTNGVGELLLEPQSKNLITQSEDLSGYSTIRGTLTLDASEVAPDGSLGVYYLTATSADGLLLDAQSTLGDATFSVYVKRKTGSGVVELSVDGAVTKTPISVTSEWQRFSLSTASGLGQLVVNCETLGDEVYVWGLQAEELSYPTSYIRNDGNVAGVTRIADAVTGNSSLGQVINSSEGVLYFEGSCPNDSKYYFSLSDGSSSNQIFLGVTSSNLFYAQIRGASSTSADMVGGTFTSDTYFKIAVKYKENDFALWVNGVEVETDDSGVTPTGLVTLKSGFWNGTNPFQGKIKELRVYDVALTDEELQNLTTL